MVTLRSGSGGDAIYTKNYKLLTNVSLKVVFPFQDLLQLRYLIHLICVTWSFSMKDNSKVACFIKVVLLKLWTSSIPLKSIESLYISVDDDFFNLELNISRVGYLQHYNLSRGLGLASTPANTLRHCRQRRGTSRATWRCLADRSYLTVSRPMDVYCSN